MASVDVYDAERGSLQSRLLESVKKCQATFGDKTTSLATESDNSVASVVSGFEQALLHGLKKKNVWEKITAISEPLRQVTQKMLPEIEISYWFVLKEYLCSLDVQHFQTLEGITTDAGRARVWLRTAINERTLESHLNSILNHKTLASQFYETWALLRDAERASTLPTMARGLASILFALDTKGSELNKPFTCIFINDIHPEIKTHRRIKSNPLPVMAEVVVEREPIVAVKTSSKKRKKKRRVNEATITDMDAIPSSTPILSSSFDDGPLATNSSDSMHSSQSDLCPATFPSELAPEKDRPLLGTDSTKTVLGGDAGKHVSTTYSNEHEKVLTLSEFGQYDPLLTSDRNMEVEESHTFPSQEMVNKIVERRLTVADEPVEYAPDYSNACLAEQLQSLNIPVDEPSEDIAKSKTIEPLALSSEQLGDDLEFSTDNIGTTISVVNLHKILSEEGGTLLSSSSKEFDALLDIGNNSKALLSATQLLSTDSFKAPLFKDSNPFDVRTPESECFEDTFKSNVEESLYDSISDTTQQDDETLITQINNENLPVVVDDDLYLSVSRSQEEEENVNSIPHEDESLLTLLHPLSSANAISHDGIRKESNEDESMEGNDILPVGSLTSRFNIQLPLFDQASSQAVNNTALVSQISSDSFLSFSNEEQQSETEGPDIEKYIPKVAQQTKEGSAGNLSSDDLKKVILANAKVKEDLEESKRLLHISFNEQQEELCFLRLEHEKMKKDFTAKTKENNEKMEQLRGENDLLRKQLKMYIEKEKEKEQEKDNGTEKSVEKIHEGPVPDVIGDIISYNQGEKSMDENMTDDEVFDKKFRQMAEMHSEVLELQENLQRQIVWKNNQIEMMKEQLVELRGPLPEDLTRQGSVSSIESITSIYSSQAKLISIWIPSSFQKMRTPDSHHLYQVYVRIGSEEWNIYRRYSQFDKLHTEICKTYPSLKEVVFPKKVFMKFDTKLVEKRRRQLQDYLRALINTFITHDPSFSLDMDRKKLIDIIPFFSESFDDSSKSNKSKNNETEVSAVYNGL